jgi:hypothetical protein
MAKAKTATFFIRRSIGVTNSAQTITIDTSAYVDPADRQGLMIEEVDFIFYNTSDQLPPREIQDESQAVQLLSGAYTALQNYDVEDLIASGGLSWAADGVPSNTTDLYPDALATPGGRIVVDDNMTLVSDASAAQSALGAAVLIKAKVVTLSNKDYMALALQTVAN